MSEETEVKPGLKITENEMMDEEKGESEMGSHLENPITVIMTEKGTTKVMTPSKEEREKESSLSEPGTSPIGSFQSLQSSQSSEVDTIMPSVSPKVRALQFEDTLSEENHKNCDLIYNSLLLGWAGNLTDLTLGMVLAEKHQTWLQVMHERLKHLIVSSEKFKEKKKAEYNTQAKTRQTNEEMGRHLKGIKSLGIGEKGKGKQFYARDNKPKIPSYYA